MPMLVKLIKERFTRKSTAQIREKFFRRLKLCCSQVTLPLVSFPDPLAIESEAENLSRLEVFLNIGAITPLGVPPAGFAQQCPRCDNSSSEVGLHNSVTLGGVVHGMRKLWRPYSQSYFWAEPPKIMLGQGVVSTT